MKSLLFVLILLLCATACQETPSPMPLPTLVRFASLSPTLRPSESPLPSATFTASPSITNSPSPSITASPPPSFTPLPSLSPLPTVTATPLPEGFIFGMSEGERNLEAYRFGTGSRVIFLVGGIHAGFESNTTQLVHEIRQYFAANPNAIREGITYLLIPSLNPDGAARGRTLEGRFNGNNVDLNRNWGCGWQEEAFFRDIPVSAGNTPFSESETRALGSLIQRVQPAAVLFYHAAANGVYAGGCEGEIGVSDDLAAIYGEAAGYPYGEGFSEYSVTGTAPAWVDSLGFPAVDVELASADSTEYARNLRAILVLQEWVLGR